MHLISNTEAESARDLRAELMPKPGDMLPVLPASFWKQTTPIERALFGRATGHYLFPTTELVDWLRHYIGARWAIEVGAGPGVLCKALGIIGTDSFMQRRADIAPLYQASGNVSTYGAHVEKLDAHEAVAKYRPEVTVAAWVTHRYDPHNHERGGNMYGPDLPALVNASPAFVFIGNATVHRHSDLWHAPGVDWDFVCAPWIVSRAINGSPDFIAVRKVRKATT